MGTIARIMASPRFAEQRRPTAPQIRFRLDEPRMPININLWRLFGGDSDGLVGRSFWATAVSPAAGKQ
jgi:hypothetical protein